MQFAVEHIGLAAADPTRMKDWYVATLGAELVFSDGKTPPAFFVRLPGGLMLEIYSSLFTPETVGDNRAGGWRHLALRVASIEPARDLLAKRGVEFEPSVKPAGGGGQVLFFKDVEGNLWHLVQRPDDSPFGRLDSEGRSSLRASA